MSDARQSLLNSPGPSETAPSSLPYRHTHPYRALWFGFLNLIILLFIFLLAQLSTWQDVNFLVRPRAWPMMGLCALGYLVSMGLGLQLRWLHRDRGYLFTVLNTIGVFLTVFAVILLTRVFYARTFLVMFFGATLVWACVVEALDHRQVRTFALVPGAMTERLRELEDGASWVPLDEPELKHPVDGLVADFREELPEKWARFVSECQAQSIPVFNAADVYEFYTGKINLDHLSEDLVQGFQLPRFYAGVRRVIELVAVVLLLPLFGLLMGLVALAIRVESGGPVLFTQTRVGRGGELFEMLKFRSMTPRADDDGPKFASEQDQRVTSVGAFLRQYRLDELPQIWNVLKGEMSIIGPRPEQVPFAEQFTEAIPFYPYRHMVRPGITGWAQVNQGYVADTDQTYEKLAYDLYYLKHFSPWLDMLITYKTVRIILTGFGAR